MILGIPWPGIDLPILGVVPVLFLMFFVKPSGQTTRQGHSACSRCASPHVPSQNFCTKCGWDLSQEYSPDASDTVLASEIHQPAATSTATVERPAEQAVPETGTHQQAPTQERNAPAPAEDFPGTAAQDSAPATADHPEPVPNTEDQPAPEEAEARPWGIPQPGPAPTAEVMTARGAALLSEGKLQEAIDQFTKAIALDPKHREALEQRAEAYTKQGRGERAEEDYRSVRALNAGS